MISNFPIATDNIYKFACLFGLAIIISSIFSYVNIYSSTLDRKVKLSEAIISIEAKEELTKAEKNALELNKKLIEIAKTNEQSAQRVIGVAFGFGLVLSIYGALQWRIRIQDRDDFLAKLQIEKIRAEIAKLELEVNGMRTPKSEVPDQETVTAQSGVRVPKSQANQ